MTSQFTDEQVEAARRARNSHDFVGHGKCRCGSGGFTSIGHGQHQARAALEAATRVPVQGEPNDEADFRLARSRGYAALKAERDFTGHMDDGRRTAYYEGFKLGRKYPQGEPNDDRVAFFERARMGANHLDNIGQTVLCEWSDGGKFTTADIRELERLASRATVPDATTAAEAFRDLGIKHLAEPDAALAEAKKQLGEIQQHFTAIAGSGEIRVYEDTGEKHGIDYQSSVWAKRGERMTRDLIEFLGEHHRPEPVGNGESK